MRNAYAGDNLKTIKHSDDRYEDAKKEKE